MIHLSTRKFISDEVVRYKSIPPEEAIHGHQSAGNPVNKNKCCWGKRVLQAAIKLS